MHCLNLIHKLNKFFQDSKPMILLLLFRAGLGWSRPKRSIYGFKTERKLYIHIPRDEFIKGQNCFVFDYSIPNNWGFSVLSMLVIVKGIKVYMMRCQSLFYLSDTKVFNNKKNKASRLDIAFFFSLKFSIANYHLTWFGKT